MEDWYRLVGFNQPMASMSHLIGAIVFLVLGFFMVRAARRTPGTLLPCSIFAGSAVLLLALSGVFHMFEPGFTTRRVMIRLDVAAIFLLIAGTFTPVHAVLFRGWKRWGVLIPLWLIAVTGITLRTIFFDSLPIVWGTGIFLLMGWVGLYSTFLVCREYGRKAGLPVIIGGVLYTIGAVGDISRWPTIIPMVWGSHVTFHLFVLAALGVHWHLISQIAEGKLTFADRLVVDVGNSEVVPALPEQASAANDSSSQKKAS